MAEGFKTEDLIDIIDFTTLLQLFNMEKKSLVLAVKIGNDTGYVAFENGEVIDAKLNKLRGDGAFKQIILKNPDKIEIIKTKKGISKTINIPFMNLLLESVKNIDDESKKNDVSGQDTENLQKQKEKSVFLEKVFNGKFKSILEKTRGFSGCFIVNSKGLLVWKHYFFLSDMNFGFSPIIDFVQKVNAKFYEIFFKEINYILLHLQDKKLFLKELKCEDFHYTVILILKLSGNETMARQALSLLDSLLIEC